MRRDERRREWWAVLHLVVEPARLRQRISIRAAARRAGMSDALWRQLVSGQHPTPGVGHRWPTRAQVLDMAASVGELEVAARAIGATPVELAAAHDRVAERPEPGEAELMALKNLTTKEKAELVKTLHRLRHHEGNPHEH